MYSIFNYSVELSPNFNFENKFGFYNFPHWNSFRRVGLQALYNAKLLSKEMLNNLLTNHLAFPILNVLEHKKMFSFCPCKVTSKENLKVMFPDFLIDKKYDELFRPKNYSVEEKHPPTLSSTIERDFSIVIPTSKCSLEFIRKCLTLSSPNEAQISDCLKSFFPYLNYTDFQFTYDFFFYNSDMKFGYTESGKIIDTDGIQGNPEHLCIFIYFTYGTTNILFILYFGSEYQKQVNSHDSLTINDEFFNYLSGSGFKPYMETCHWWGYQGISTCNNYFCFNQDEFIPLK